MLRKFAFANCTNFLIIYFIMFLFLIKIYNKDRLSLPSRSETSNWEESKIYFHSYTMYIYKKDFKLKEKTFVD